MQAPNSKKQPGIAAGLWKSVMVGAFKEDDLKISGL
jgi:hypothetical protein